MKTVQCRQIIFFGKSQKILITEFQNQQEVNLKKGHMQLRHIVKNISVILNRLIQKITNFGQLMNQITVQTKTVQVTLNQTYQINYQTIIKSM